MKSLNEKYKRHPSPGFSGSWKETPPHNDWNSCAFNDYLQYNKSFNYFYIISYIHSF